jgi:hypothetical protein
VREFLAVCVFFFFSFLWPSGCCFFLLASSGRDVAAAVLATSNSCGSFAWYGSQIQIGKSLCLVSLMFYCFFFSRALCGGLLFSVTGAPECFVADVGGDRVVIF